MKPAKPKKVIPPTAMETAVRALREDALAHEVGELIGSEDDLIARHSVSRPTLRQAAALVAQEQLLQVRRGVGGGYIARRPTSKAVTHMAAIFLRAKGAGLEEIIQSIEPIRVELARLAALRINDESRAELRDYLDREAQRASEGTGSRAFFKGEREFGEILGRTSGNSVLALFLEILYDLAATLRPEHDIYLGRPERIIEYRAKRNLIAQAVLDGDADIAVLASHRCSALGVKWMMHDHGRAYSVAAADGSRHLGTFDDAVDERPRKRGARSR